MSDRLIVNEIFHSIQGESTFAGRRCVFVRLTGCNLRCEWCDTTYAYEQGEPMSVGQVVAKVRSFGCPLVEVTGGEPLLQPAVLGLMTRLADTGLTVLLETNGSVDISAVDERVHRIVDVKCPGSGEAERNRLENLELLTHRDEVKFVLADRADYEWAVDLAVRFGLAGRCRAVLFGCVAQRLAAGELAAWILSDRPTGVRIQVPLHRVIWPDVDRGV